MFENSRMRRIVPRPILIGSFRMRWDIEHTRQVIGYVARDGHVAVSTPAIEETEQLGRLKYAPRPLHRN